MQALFKIALLAVGTTSPLAAQVTTELNIESRGQFNGIPQGDQKRAFRSLTPQAKYLLWEDKLRTVLAHESLAAPEFLAISELYNLLSPEWYSAADAGDDQEIQQMLSAWTAGALEVFDREDLAKIVLTLLDVDGGHGESHGPVPQVQPIVGSSGNIDCECGDPQGLFFMDCAGASIDCEETTNCTKTRGCGILWLQTCDGLCDYPKPRPQHVSAAPWGGPAFLGAAILAVFLLAHRVFASRSSV